ncbi:MAG: outer membrane protein assembly factor BamA, partial [Candidatus Lindowbacteria bacterium]|nr:outer membrane protein assembly factor BamA [Candidatus Lindowbacteria bacterium]
MNMLSKYLGTSVNEVNSVFDAVLSNRGLRLLVYSLCILILTAFISSPAAWSQVQDTPKIFEEAALAREEAAIIWENLGDKIKASEAWAEAAGSWEKAAEAYERTNSKKDAARAWKKFQEAASKRDKAVVRLSIRSGNSQKVKVSSSPRDFVVKVTSNEGKPVSGLTVLFDLAVTPTGEESAKIEPNKVISDSEGLATVRLKLGTIVGKYVVTATVRNLADDPVIFDLEAKPGKGDLLEIVSGNNQVLRVDQKALSPLMVKVTDKFGNPIEEQEVDYRIVSEPEGAEGQSLSRSTTRTDASGLAGVQFQAGSVGGSYIVLVESGDLNGSPSKFELMVRRTIPTVEIIELRYEGARDTPSLIAGSRIREGETYLLPDLGRTFRTELKRLYATGRFKDVSIWIQSDENDDAKGVAIIRVKERPLIGSVEIKGTRKVKEDDLLSVLGISEGSPFSMSAVERSRLAILDYLEAEGFLNANVSAETGISVSEVKGEADQITVTFNVDEKKKVKIYRFNIYGNDYYSDWSLNWHMKTGKGKVFKEQEFEADKSKMLGRYFENGYLSAKMLDPIITFDKKGRMIVDLIIEEGPQYKIGEITFNGNTALSDGELMAMVKPIPGKVFRAKKFFGSIEKMRMATAKFGFAEARFVPQEKLNLDVGLVDFLIKIQEGPILYLEALQLEGNFKTQDKIIIREIYLVPGDRLDGEEITKAKKRLEGLGFFEPGSVQLSLIDGSDSTQRVLMVKVTEGKTGQLQFGAGFSSQDGLVGFLSVSKKNFDPTDFFSFTGAGQAISLSAEIGGQKNSFSFSWTEPYFRNKPIALGFDVFNTFQEREGFDWRRRGGGLRLSHKYGEYGRLSYKYEAEQIQIQNVTNVAPVDIQVEAGFPASTQYTRTTTSITTGFTHDTRNDKTFPSHGHYLDLSNELAGEFLGGNVSFSRPVFSLSVFRPVFTKHVIAWRGQYGSITNFFDKGNEIPSTEKFFLGGSNSIRGYAERSVQLYTPTQVLLGPGKSFILSNLEYRIPFTEDKSISMALFSDAGGVFK